jgi:asparagine synthase (glutamine-hydrolysing)
MANAHLQEYIYEARKTLVGLRILKKDILEKKIQPLDAHTADNADWRYLVTGTLIR